MLLVLGLLSSLGGASIAQQSGLSTPATRPYVVRGQSDDSDGLLGALNPKYALDKAKVAAGLGPR